MPASKAQQKAVHKYTKENYDRFLVTMKPKGRLELVKSHAAAQGESTNAFIGRAIAETMERDTLSRDPLSRELALARSMNTIAEYYGVSPHDVLDELRELIDRDTPGG